MTASHTASEEGAVSSTAAARLIADSRLIAIVRADTEPEIVAAMQALDGAGARVAEVSLATSGALAALERCAEELSDRLLLGAGTVRTLGDAERALEAGARFLVSPNLDRDVCALARERGVLHLPGIFSPTELADALASGAELIKLFPAGRLGPGYVRDLLQPFPDARLVSTGGISQRNAREFLDAGAVAVAVGSALVGPDTIREPDRIRAALREFQSLISDRTSEEEERPHGD